MGAQRAEREPDLARKMSAAERETFLLEPRIGVLSVEREGAGPLSTPTWFDYREGRICFQLSATARRMEHLRAAGRATLCAHHDVRPYSYVSVEGPVVFEDRTSDDIARMAGRYIGEDAGRSYADGVTWAGYNVALLPERWSTLTYAQ